MTYLIFPQSLRFEEPSTMARLSSQVSVLLVGLSLFLTTFFHGIDEVGCFDQDQKFQSFRSLLPSEQPYRTAYHFQSRQNWLNDPNGPMYYKGVYHLFYQYNPNGPLFGDIMVWGHSASHDLINWFSLDIALSPSESFDINSCWSGSVTILPGDKPVILYTGIDANKRQVQNLALPKNVSDPLLRDWVKYSGNPLMTPPDGVDNDDFRDPSTAWHDKDGVWRVIVGSEMKSEGMVFLYRSEDFVNWTRYPEPLYSAEKTGIWECPDFFPVSTTGKNGLDTSIQGSSVKHVLKVSLLELQHEFYVLGSYHTELQKFIPEKELTGTSSALRYDYGKFYASKSFFDSGKNRRILWGWVNESDSSEDDIAKGWSGVQAVPRQIWLDQTGKQLMQWPVEEINSLRGNKVSFHGMKLESGSVLEVSGITASQADVEMVFELPKPDEAEFMDSNSVEPQLICSEANASVNGKYGPFGLLALATTDLAERTAIFFRVFKNKNSEGYVVLMCNEQSRSSLREGLDKTTYGAFVDIDPRAEHISLRSLIDHSIVESFAGEGKTVITARVYPKLAVDKDAHLYAFNNGTLSVTISRLTPWSMKKADINSMEGFNDAPSF